MVENLRNCLLKIKHSPLEQSLIIATTSYLGFRTVQTFPKETHFKTHYFGKTLSLISATAILHFSGLLCEKSFVSRIGFSVFKLGPFECSVSMEKIIETIYNFFKTVA